MHQANVSKSFSFGALKLGSSREPTVHTSSDNEAGRHGMVTAFQPVSEEERTGFYAWSEWRPALPNFCALTSFPAVQLALPGVQLALQVRSPKLVNSTNTEIR
jgi:hypothetical protein